MPTIFRVLLTFGAFAVGLVLAAAMLAVTLMLLGLWSLRGLYLKMARRPVPPFTPRFRPREAFRGARRSSPARDVIDVEARHLP